MRQIWPVRRLSRFVTALLDLGDRYGDTDDEKIGYRYLAYVAMAMALAGLLLGALCSLCGLWKQAVLPYSLTLLTFINFFFFHRTGNFRLTRLVQVLIGLLLPFLFQWSLGGFLASGTSMLWAMLALLGSLTFQNARTSVAWLCAYLGLTLLSGFFDDRVQQAGPAIPWHTSKLFFVLNITAMSATVFLLSAYFLAKREEAKIKLAEMTSVLKKMFGRYLSTEVMNSVLANPSALELGGERRAVTIMMSDLRGFTAISERLEPERVVQMLNSYFEVMLRLVLKYNGTINEITGDTLLIVFGAPQEMPDRARRAIACAIEMQNAMAEVNAQNRAEGL
ncbi:adenylate/guanylate cyclase domain-containing protein, partial [Streptomyces sp. NPDC057910]|uniref:adenylate/guanylate cyclase domain-containing protein n=1 Tax=Streptomyces sp. NPDC057910 TaxID=3346278 RepID=UPI0036EC7A8C